MLPGNETIKGKPSEWVYENSDNAFRLLMQGVYSFANPPHTLPFAGGLLEQPRIFLDAWRMFKLGETLYSQQNKKTSEVLKSLGAKR